MTLAVVAAILCLMLVLAGASMGLTGSLAFSQPSPSGSASEPAGESGKIFLLNPNGTYDPRFPLTQPPREPSDPRQPPEPDPPKISDKFDGVDEAYHVVAVVKDPPPTALVEAYYAASGQNEVTIGQLSPVPGSPDTYELLWDVNENTINAGFGTFTVRLFAETPAGFEEVSADEEAVRIQHETSLNLGEPQIEESETAELLWPSQNGPLGFYKASGAGTWATWVEGTVSQGIPGTSGPPPAPQNQGPRNTYQVRLYYSVSPIGTDPQYVLCNTALATGAARPDGSRRFAGNCTLTGTHVPSKVTALAVVAVQDEDPDDPAETSSGVNTRAQTQEGADAHRVQPYVQQVDDMTLELTSNTASDSGQRRHVVQASSNDVACTSYMITVKDALDRPVQGANVDVHLRGPGDSIQFGDEGDSGRTHSAYASPKSHSTEAGRDCDGSGNWADLQQGDHNSPGADDTKHLESAPTGTGLSAGGGASAGQWKFQVWSERVGDTAITAWVDDEPLLNETDKRPADDDLPEAAEATDTNFAQWLPSAVTVTLDPTGATAAAGSCQKFIVRVRGGTRLIRGANVDVHATGPTNDLDFCDPGDGSPRRAPDAGIGHNAEDEGEMVHAGEPPVAQHTEGVTNDQGNLVIGISSPEAGDTTLTAWYDSGEDTFDNDNQDAGEATGTATTNWIVATGDAAISFLNPSPYGSAGTNVGRKQDVDAAFHLVARVSALNDISGVEFFYRSGTNPLVKIGDATRVGQTDAYEAYWPADVADGPYTLVARIRDTEIAVEQAVTVRNQGSMIDPTVVPFETAEITAPLDGQRATFSNRKLTVRGVTSAGAEGVHLYYTKAGPLTTPAAGAWTQCGTSTLPSATAPKEFTLDCTLVGSDQPALVTGIAAIAYNCFQDCRASQSNHSGDAHRVFGVEANPLLSMEPAETAADLGECVKFVVSLTDQTGQAIPDRNLDVHMTGPGNSGNFCAPEDGTGTPRRAPNDAGHLADGDETDEAYHEEGGGRIQHTEAESTGNGRLVFGIESETAGDTQLTLWLDDNDNDVQDQGEIDDVSIMHWLGDEQGSCDITGTNGPDVLEGSDASEKICGFGGNDTIRGRGGNDDIGGGAGNDSLRGGGGNDRVGGGAGNDKAFGGGGKDRVSGGGGRDLVKGQRSNDRLRGNRGNDRLTGGRGRDDCRGGRGRDRLRSCETGTRSFAARTRPI